MGGDGDGRVGESGGAEAKAKRKPTIQHNAKLALLAVAHRGSSASPTTVPVTNFCVGSRWGLVKGHMEKGRGNMRGLAVHCFQEPG